MLTADFSYELPEELIAQEPIEPRDHSRLLVLHRDTGAIEHRIFHEILDYFRPGDVVVANETRVIPARLHARKLPTRGRVELLLLSKLEDTCWEALVTGRRAHVGQRLALAGGLGREVLGVVEAITPAGARRIRFEAPIDEALEELGEMPLPPYIHKQLSDPERLQTVYGQTPGSVAAATAGLHFTSELLERTRTLGVQWEFVLLNIGLDTFRPVSEERVEEHAIHTEWCRITSEAAERISAAKREGRRVIALGTTAVRVLETVARDDGSVAPYQGATDLYIYPGFRFRVVDALITNFHLPRSSLIMLVSALASRDLILAAYREAVARRYRFYSLGDAMLIV